MAFFLYNNEHEDGREYLYQQFPTHYTYDEKQKTWHKRKKGIAIGRMYNCNPFMGEKYYLRMLLTTVRGPKSFQDVFCHLSFKSACIALGLLADDNEWIQCFTEAIIYLKNQQFADIYTSLAGLADRLTDRNGSLTARNGCLRLGRISAVPVLGSNSLVLIKYKE